MSLLRRLLAPLMTEGRGQPSVDAASAPDRRRAGAGPTPIGMDRASIIAEASALADAGRLGESLGLIDNALLAAPDDAEIVFARASTLFVWNRFHEAREAAARAASLGLAQVPLHLQLGRLCYRAGAMNDAEAWMRKALTAEPGAWAPHLDLAVVLVAQKRPADAAASFERALTLHPDDFDCLMGLANCRLAQDDPVAAEVHLRRAIAVDPESAAGWNQLGVALGRQDRYQEARVAFLRAAQLEETGGGDDDSFVNLTVNLRDAGQTREALDLFEATLARKPSVYALLGYAHVLLLGGHLPEGWHFYEFRWLHYPLRDLRPGFDLPVWSGQNLDGKTILLREEQGFGDMIQFIRYAKYVKALGATVLVRTTPAMTNLARGFPGIDRVLAPGEPNPNFDYYINLLSLPRVFGTDVDSVPAEVPYLHAEAERMASWAPRLGPAAALKIGIAWAGSPLHQADRYRSISLHSIAPLAARPGVRLYSLQKGPAADRLQSSPPDFEIVNLGPELEDFCDTAAVIAQLDLVICVDTAVAHLAGALGKRVWVLLPQPPDFRWLEHSEETPWYPTMRLFRQRVRGDWDDVVERVAAALDDLLQGRTPAIAVSAERGAPPTLLPVKLVGAAPPRGHRRGFSAVVEARAGILQYLPDEAIEGASLRWYGEYLQPQLKLLAQFVQPGSVIIEVGTGVGAHTLVLAHAAGAAGHLFLYESRPVVRRILQQNLEANHVSNFTLMRRTLASQRGNGATAAVESSVANPSTVAPPTVASTETVDELRLQRLNWIKVNPGVAALEVLDGAPDTLWRLRPWLFLAAADEATLTALANRAREFGYRCWRMESPLFNPENFNRRDDDIFSGGVALALLAFPEEIEVDVALDGCVELS